MCSGARHSCQLPSGRFHSTSALTKEPLLVFAICCPPALVFPTLSITFLTPSFLCSFSVLQPPCQCLALGSWPVEENLGPYTQNHLVWASLPTGLQAQREAGMSVHWVSPMCWALKQKEGKTDFCHLIFKEPRPKDVTSSSPRDTFLSFWTEYILSVKLTDLHFHLWKGWANCSIRNFQCLTPLLKELLMVPRPCSVIHSLIHFHLSTSAQDPGLIPVKEIHENSKSLWVFFGLFCCDLLTNQYNNIY